ncbi:MAG TPA: glycerol-3-phosphate dehydrogenase/oxidase [Acidimicrobiales bacterium]|nr:glycerol-3-phosphate dehydrogenase/oxidase [Acidimicrobiales bacterium]
MSSFERAGAWRALSTRRFDLVVIGAGMTGAGVALDAASRGLSVALVDAGDFASGTSSKSSKMVHGGLRYLQQREFRLVYENLRERQRLLENVPYLVTPLPFLIPIFTRNNLLSKSLVKGYATALRLYDWSGGWRIGHRYRRVSKEEALTHLPTLKTSTLAAGFLYYDARGDDARVALTLAKSAVDFGAIALNYVRVIAVSKDESGRVRSVRLRDERSGDEREVATTCVVNATGVWADEIFEMTEKSDSHQITPAKGVHVSVARDRLPADVAAVFNVPGDRRSVFVVPFDDAPYTFIGTTDTPYDGELDEPLATAPDIAYLLNAVNAATTSDLGVQDVTGVWAGLRPLLAPKDGEALHQRTSDLSRRHRITDTHDGVVHVTGGKWTTYRKMAQDAVDALGPYVSIRTHTRTKKLALHGVSPWRPTNALEEHLYRRFGADAPVVLELIELDSSLGEAMIKNQPYVGAEFVFAVRDEMATSLVDLLTRRTRAHLHDARATLLAAAAIAALVAPVAGWSDAETHRQVEEYEALVRREFEAAGLTVAP